jgi:transposase
MIMHFEQAQNRVVGSAGQLTVHPEDHVARRFIMLLEGECELGATVAARKFDMTRQRFYQLRSRYDRQGLIGLEPRKPGPKTNYVRTDEVIRQVIRHRFLDPDASTGVIAQKMRQAGFPVSARSVDRIVNDYGLQKKNLSLRTSR